MARRWLAAPEACALCAAIGPYAEVDNPQDPDAKEVFDDLPAEVHSLTVPNRWLERTFRYHPQRLLQCPRCGAYYWYRKWAPGGSDDAMHTAIHESVTRLTAREALDALAAEAAQSRERAEREPGLYRREAEAAARGLAVEVRRLRQRGRWPDR